MEDNKKDLQTPAAGDFNFMKERIKERPLNKRKLLRRTLLTASMAVLFGLVACFTVLVLEPVLSNWLYPEEPAENITFPAETEEILPEDMALDDEELLQENEPELQPEIPNIQEKQEDVLDVYKEVYRSLQSLSDEISRSLVTVTGISSDRDWFDNEYENRGQTAGVIVANNGKEYLILANEKPIAGVETIQVTFCDNTQAQAGIKKSDPITGLAILSIEMKNMEEKTMAHISTAVLGGSNSVTLKGSPVIAMGSPLGISGSMVYGTVTSTGNLLDTADSQYKLITTDIYGSREATGILVDLQGSVVGVINQNYNSNDMRNRISAIGISELKKTIERLSNGKDQAYLGIYGKDVPDDANQTLQVPFGTYVADIEMDSPAMDAGIQRGDVIVDLNGTLIDNYRAYIDALTQLRPGNTIHLTLMRQNQGEYTPIELQVIPGTAQ